MMKIHILFSVLILLFCDITSGWIRFQYPVSRREYLQQTSLEKLQNCAGKQECGICGEGPGEISTSIISTASYSQITGDNLVDGTVTAEIGFRAGLGTKVEFRLCALTDNSTRDADMCTVTRPLLIQDEAAVGNEAVVGNQFRPANDQKFAQIRLQIPAKNKCERCVIQAKYMPGPFSDLKRHTFYDCALVVITPNKTSLPTVTVNPAILPGGVFPPDHTMVVDSRITNLGTFINTKNTLSTDNTRLSTDNTRLSTDNTRLSTDNTRLLTDNTRTGGFDANRGALSMGRFNTAMRGTNGDNTGGGGSNTVITRVNSWTIEVEPNLNMAAENAHATTGNSNSRVSVNIEKRNETSSQITGSANVTDKFNATSSTLQNIDNSTILNAGVTTDVINSTLNDTYYYYYDESSTAPWNETAWQTNTTNVTGSSTGSSTSGLGWEYNSTNTDRNALNETYWSGQGTATQGNEVVTHSNSSVTDAYWELNTTMTNLNDSLLLNTVENNTKYVTLDLINKTTGSKTVQQEIVHVPDNIIVLPVATVTPAYNQRVIDVNVTRLEEKIGAASGVDITNNAYSNVNEVHTRNNRFDTAGNEITYTQNGQIYNWTETTILRNTTTHGVGSVNTWESGNGRVSVGEENVTSASPNIAIVKISSATNTNTDIGNLNIANADRLGATSFNTVSADTNIVNADRSGASSFNTVSADTNIVNADRSGASSFNTVSADTNIVNADRSSGTHSNSGSGNLNVVITRHTFDINTNAGSRGSNIVNADRSSSTNANAGSANLNIFNTNQASATNSNLGSGSSNIITTRHSFGTNTNAGSLDSNIVNSDRSSGTNINSGSSSSNILITDRSFGTDVNSRSSNSNIIGTDRSSVTNANSGSSSLNTIITDHSSARNANTGSASSNIINTDQSSATNVNSGSVSSNMIITDQFVGTNGNGGAGNSNIINTGQSSATHFNSGSARSNIINTDQSSATNVVSGSANSNILITDQTSEFSNSRTGSSNIINGVQSSSTNVDSRFDRSNNNNVDQAAIVHSGLESNRNNIIKIDHVASGVNSKLPLSPVSGTNYTIVVTNTSRTFNTIPAGKPAIPQSSNTHIDIAQNMDTNRVVNVNANNVVNLGTSIRITNPNKSIAINDVKTGLNTHTDVLRDTSSTASSSSSDFIQTETSTNDYVVGVLPSSTITSTSLTSSQAARNTLTSIPIVHSASAVSTPAPFVFSTSPTDDYFSYATSELPTPNQVNFFQDETIRVDQFGGIPIDTGSAPDLNVGKVNINDKSSGVNVVTNEFTNFDLSRMFDVMTNTRSRDANGTNTVIQDRGIDVTNKGMDITRPIPISSVLDASSNVNNLVRTYGNTDRTFVQWETIGSNTETINNAVNTGIRAGSSGNMGRTGTINDASATGVQTRASSTDVNRTVQSGTPNIVVNTGTQKGASNNLANTEIIIEKSRDTTNTGIIVDGKGNTVNTGIRFETPSTSVRNGFTIKSESASGNTGIITGASGNVGASGIKVETHNTGIKMGTLDIGVDTGSRSITGASLNNVDTAIKIGTSSNNVDTGLNIGFNTGNNLQDLDQWKAAGITGNKITRDKKVTTDWQPATLPFDLSNSFNNINTITDVKTIKPAISRRIGSWDTWKSETGIRTTLNKMEAPVQGGTTSKSIVETVTGSQKIGPSGTTLFDGNVFVTDPSSTTFVVSDKSWSSDQNQAIKGQSLGDISSVVVGTIDTVSDTNQPSMKTQVIKGQLSDTKSTVVVDKVDAKRVQIQTFDNRRPPPINLDISLNGAANINRIKTHKTDQENTFDIDSNRAPDVMPPIVIAIEARKKVTKPANIIPGNVINEQIGSTVEKRVGAWDDSDGLVWGNIRTRNNDIGTGWNSDQSSTRTVTRVTKTSGSVDKRTSSTVGEEIKKSALNESTMWDINRLADATPKVGTMEVISSTPVEVDRKQVSSSNVLKPSTSTKTVTYEVHTTSNLNANKPVQSDINTQVLKTLEALMLEMKARELSAENQTTLFETVNTNAPITDERIKKADKTFVVNSWKDVSSGRARNVFGREGGRSRITGNTNTIDPLYIVDESVVVDIPNNRNVPYDINLIQGNNVAQPQGEWITSPLINREFVAEGVRRSELPLNSLSTTRNIDQSIIKTNNLPTVNNNLIASFASKFAAITSGNYNNAGVLQSSTDTTSSSAGTTGIADIFGSATDSIRNANIVNRVNPGGVGQSVINAVNVDVTNPFESTLGGHDRSKAQTIIRSSGREIHNPFEGIGNRFSRADINRLQNFTRLSEVTVQKNQVNELRPAYTETVETIPNANAINGNTVVAANLNNNPNAGAVSIEGKYFIGQMRRNPQGHFEPVPLAADFVTATNPAMNSFEAVTSNTHGSNFANGVGTRVNTNSANNRDTAKVTVRGNVQSNVEESPINVANTFQTVTVETNRPIVTDRTGVQSEFNVNAGITDIPQSGFNVNAGITDMPQSGFNVNTGITDIPTQGQTKPFYSQEQLLNTYSARIEPIGFKQNNNRANFIGQNELLKQFGIQIGSQDVPSNDQINLINALRFNVSGDVLGQGDMNCDKGSVLVCKAVGKNQYIPGMVWWCFSHCRNGICPSEKCQCACENLQREFGSVASNTSPSKGTLSAASLTRGKQKVTKIIKLTLNGSEESVGPVREVAAPLARIIDQNNAANVVITSRTEGSRSRSTLDTSGLPSTGRNTIGRSMTVMSHGGNNNLGNSGTLNVEFNTRGNTKTLNCKGINAFSTTEGIDAWCTRLCRRNMCPLDICRCT